MARIGIGGINPFTTATGDIRDQIKASREIVEAVQLIKSVLAHDDISPDARPKLERAVQILLDAGETVVNTATSSAHSLTGTTAATTTYVPLPLKTDDDK